MNAKTRATLARFAAQLAATCGLLVILALFAIAHRSEFPAEYACPAFVLSCVGAALIVRKL